jgi:DNA-binding Lrp family transcriptional regulator
MNKIIDAWDTKILSEIEFDYRKSHQEIAKRIKRSKTFVTYRIKKMEDSGLIKYQPLIDYATLGYTYYRVIIETILDKKEITKYIKESIKTIWLVEKYDQENFVLVFAVKSFGEFQEAWEQLYERIAPHVLSKNISLAYRVYHMPMTFLTKHSRDDYYVTGASSSKILTAQEERIVDFLIKNPSSSFKDIAKMVHVSMNTLKKLLNNLYQNKIILAFQTLINKELLNIQHYKLFLSFDFTSKNKLKVIELLKNNPNVVYITETSYSYDLECELYTFDNSSFEKIIRDLKTTFPFRRIVISQMKSEEKLS